MKSKITVIGAGSVGATIAYTLSNEDIATEIVLIDINKQKAEGEVMDIIQGTCFRDPISIKSGDYEDAKDSNIVIITSGVARKPGQSRLELTQTNVDIIKSIAPNIAKAAPNALYIIVSNPVDIITYVFMKISGIPENQIIGSGTALDTARLRFGLASHFNIAQKNIHAYVFGEHGDSSFIPWSCAEVSGAKLDDYVELMHALPVDKDAMAEYVHKSGGEIIKNKGATFYAVTVSVCRLCSMLLSAYNSIVTVSTMMHGEYGLEDVCISTLAIVGPNGVQGKLPVRLTEDEMQKLHASADKLKETIGQIYFGKHNPKSIYRKDDRSSYEVQLLSGMYPLRTKAKDLDAYARASAKALGFELEEIENWQCCGGVYPLGSDEIATKLSSVRALNEAKEKGQDLVTLCSACHHVIKRVNDDMRNVEDIRTRANNYMQLDEPYAGETNVLHYLEVLRDRVGFDELKKKVVNPLKGRKIGAYYGCLLLQTEHRAGL